MRKGGAFLLILAAIIFLVLFVPVYLSTFISFPSPTIPVTELPVMNTGTSTISPSSIPSPLPSPTAEISYLARVIASNSLNVRICNIIENCLPVAWLLNDDLVVVMSECVDGWVEITRGGWVKSSFLTPDKCETR